MKVELHAHTDEDPDDRLAHSTAALVERAAACGYGAMAVTLHDRYFDPAPWTDLARACGLVLLSGIERSIDGRHVLLVNFPREVAEVQSFDDVARLKAATRGLVVAPHPFFPTRTALGARLDEIAALIDAVEINAMYTAWIDFNRRARTWAAAHGKPLVGNSDLHQLNQLGTTYSEVDAPADPDAICEAIRAGRVTLHTEPLSMMRAATTFAGMVAAGLAGRFTRRAPR